MNTSQSIAASIAAELRAYPERWRHHATGLPGDPPDTPRCLLGLIEKRGHRTTAPIIRAFAKYLPQLPHLHELMPENSCAAEATEIMIWNDKQDLAAIIALCDKVASSEPETRNFAREIEAQILKQTVGTEAISEELTW